MSKNTDFKAQIGIFICIAWLWNISALHNHACNFFEKQVSCLRSIDLFKCRGVNFRSIYKMYSKDVGFVSLIWSELFPNLIINIP